MGIFFGVMTVANVVIASQLSYRAVEQMDTVQFCGATCHVMKPEFTAHAAVPPHQAVACAECHIAPGATGWLKAKMAGTNQLFAVMFNTYPRPIESAMENNKLVSSADTCEQCHQRDTPIGPRLRVIPSYARRSAEYPHRNGTVDAHWRGNFGRHSRRASWDRAFASATPRPTKNARPSLGWNTRTRKPACRELISPAARRRIRSVHSPLSKCSASIATTAPHTLSKCPSARSTRPWRLGQIAPSLLFVKKESVELLKASYASDDEAAQKIPVALSTFYQQKYPDAASKQGAAIQAAGRTLAAIYQSNVFPDLKVTWGTYPNNLGHTDDPGCFRCHDASHMTSDNKTITQDCNACHQPVAMDEASPDILKTLELTPTQNQ